MGCPTCRTSHVLSPKAPRDAGEEHGATPCSSQLGEGGSTDWCGRERTLLAGCEWEKCGVIFQFLDLKPPRAEEKRFPIQSEQRKLEGRF